MTHRGIAHSPGLALEGWEAYGDSGVERRKRSQGPEEAPRSGEGYGNGNSVWCQVPGEGGYGDGKKRSEKEVEKQSPGVLKSTRR